MLTTYNMQEEPIVVAIRCITYNHELYIRQCLEGFIIQKTNFKFVAIVHDDASTDGTAKIIQEYAARYPEIIKPIYETENQYSKKDDSLRKIMDNATNATKCKYVAVCEGDDYWIDPLKLQKQVDFLEANLDYGLIHSYFNYVDVNNNVIDPPTSFYKNMRERIFDGYIWDYYLNNSGFILTCTCMYRRDLLRLDEKTFFDHGLFMMIARQSKVYCLREVTSCYRRNPQGAMCSNHNNVRILHSKVLLYQIYYFISGRPCSQFYLNNSKTECAVRVAYTNLILKICGLSSSERKILYETARIKLSLLLYVPYFIIRKIIQKFFNHNN